MRRRRFRTRRTGFSRKTDWLVFGTYGTSDSGVDSAAPVVLTEGNPVAESLVDQSDMLDHEQGVTVLRVVGQLHISSAWQVADSKPVPIPLMVTMGMMAQETTGSGDVLTMDLKDIEIIENEWMWLRSIVPGCCPSFVFTEAAGVFSKTEDTSGLFTTLDIDIRVKRKLKGVNSALSMWFVAQRYAPPSTTNALFVSPGHELYCTVVPQLRILIKQA